MISIKTPKEISIMRSGGAILAWVLNEVIKKIKPGVSTGELDSLVEKLIKEKGGKPSFKGYRAAWAEEVYPAALCVSINNEVVHGIPQTGRILKDGDIVGLDCGLEYQKLFTDMAKTVGVGKISAEARKLIVATEEALAKAIKQIKPGRHISDVSRTIEECAQKNNFSIVRQLVGHGVGFSAHEEPQIPNYLDSRVPDIELQAGMTLAIEPMINVGGWEVETLDDGWTVATRDKSLSAHFEHTVAVTAKGYEILTK